MPVTSELPEPFRRFDLSGRVAVVTGASSGLGAGLARGLAGAGARVAVVARRESLLKELAADIDGLAIAFDLSDLGHIGDVVPRVAEGLGTPEILVNTAGNVFSPPSTRPEDESLDDVLATMHLNLVAALRLAQAVYPGMRALGRGSVVNVSSINGHVGIPGVPNLAYTASKFGLSGITKELAVQWARRGIRVNTIAPGYFRSDITESLYASDKGEAWLREHTPLPYHGTVEDFVGAVLWLVSDAGRYVTGQTIVIDGGWTSV
jgi:NAD(P)-dependent dehydrogenase (short-subunit alcohol dehydrogenase family)